MKTDGWSTDYARLLTKDQWTSELDRRFFDDIRREITSLAVREPVRLALEQHSLEALGDNEHSNWKIYNVSISEEISSLFVIAYFWQVAPPWQDIGVEPILPGDDVPITVQAVLRIDNEGSVSSEVIDVSLDPDSLGPSEEWYTDDVILALRLKGGRPLTLTQRFPLKNSTGRNRKPGRNSSRLTLCRSGTMMARAGGSRSIRCLVRIITPKGRRRRLSRTDGCYTAPAPVP
jgi:hypothetical protein